MVTLFPLYNYLSIYFIVITYKCEVDDVVTTNKRGNNLIM